jgi:endogenous inhibitor of DNA gyrase (YacG/DUF329 family)
MPRRKPYTKVIKHNQLRADHVKGMGDVVFKGFQCLNYKCTEYIFVRKDEIETNLFEIKCPVCGFMHKSGEETKFYDYTLKNINTGSTIETDAFLILHDDYINEAEEYKYCIICNTLKPLEFFHLHSSRKSGRQGECDLCKTIYNSIKNQTRITEQHREAAQKRRLYIELSGIGKIDSKEILKRFEYKCFKCGKNLKDVKDEKERPFDHTLPASYLWPLTTENATLLCKDHNGEKTGKWPSEYYSQMELRQLSVMTGYDYDLLAGPPIINPEAIEKLKKPSIVDDLLHRYGAYMDEIIKIRNKILSITGFDFFKHSRIISNKWKRKADEQLKTNKKPLGKD